MYLFCREIFVNNTDYLTNSDDKAEYLKTKDGIYLYKQRLVDYQHASSRNININTRINNILCLWLVLVSIYKKLFVGFVLLDL